MSISHLFLVFIALPSALSQGSLTGCPSYGCTPSGSFSLLTSSGIPRSGVKVIWSVRISNSSGTGSPLLGCVSNSNHLVCPTPHGFVGVDADTGKILWNRTILDHPSLPIMDVFGDVIGSDGKHLVKVDGDGTVEHPVIPLDPPMVPIYSVEYADENILLLVSETGELVAYLTNGIPLANLFLRGNVQNYNGTFHPIAQPVMNGSRAYILTQFRPESPSDIPREKLATLGLQRLYAIDVRHAMVLIIDIAWYLNLETEVKGHFREVESGQDRTMLYSGEKSSSLNDKLDSQYESYQDKLYGDMTDLVQELNENDSQRLSEKGRLLRILNEISVSDRIRKPQYEQVFTNDFIRRPKSRDNIVHMEQDIRRPSDPSTRTSRKGHKVPNQVPQQSSLLYFYGTILAIVAPPADNCILSGSRHCGQAVNATLWGVNDLGANYTVCYTNLVSLARMSVYDPGYNPSSGFQDSKCLPESERMIYHRNKKDVSGALGEGHLVWTVTEYGDVINGFDQISSQVQQRVNVSRMLNTSVQITSRVMVSTDAHHPADLLVFGVRRTNGNHTDVIHDVMSNGTNHVIAVNTSMGEAFESIMWTFPAPYDYEVQGQIATTEDMGSNNSSFVAMANGTSGQIVFAFK